MSSLNIVVVKIVFIFLVLEMEFSMLLLLVLSTLALSNFLLVYLQREFSHTSGNFHFFSFDNDKSI